MCKKRSSVNGVVVINHNARWIRVDACIRHLVNSLSLHGYRTVGSCCGHGIYPMTIICQVGKQKRYFDLISGKDIPRTRNFYKLDSKGFYYIPEVANLIIKGDEYDEMS